MHDRCVSDLGTTFRFQTTIGNYGKKCPKEEECLQIQKYVKNSNLLRFTSV